MEKVLTVSIAAYNVADYLPQTLDSLICEEVMDKMEVIIVNDGSKDNTAEIAQRYVDLYPNTFKLINKENGGWGSTINESSKVATGKYYKLLDGDDWFETDNLPEFIRLLENSDTDLVYTQYTRVYEPDMKKELIELDHPYNKVLDAFLLDDCCNMHTLTVKTKIVNSEYLDITKHCFYTDMEFYVKVLRKAENFVGYPISVYCYRLGREGQSVSARSHIKNFRQHETVMKKVLDIMDGNPKLERMKFKSGLSILTTHLQTILIMKPTSENYKKLKEFKKIVLKEQSWAIKHLRMYEKAVIACPWLFYVPCVLYKRKKHDINI